MDIVQHTKITKALDYANLYLRPDDIENLKLVLDLVLENSTDTATQLFAGALMDLLIRAQEVEDV